MGGVNVLIGYVACWVALVTALHVVCIYLAGATGSLWSSVPRQKRFAFRLNGDSASRPIRTFHHHRLFWGVLITTKSRVGIWPSGATWHCSISKSRELEHEAENRSGSPGRLKQQVSSRLCLPNSHTLLTPHGGHYNETGKDARQSRACAPIIRKEYLG